MVKKQRNMQKRKKQSKHKNPEKRMKFVDKQIVEEKFNQYICQACSYITTTIQRGNDVNKTTPMFLTCDECEGRMVSQMYRVNQDIEPTHEWYTPEKPPKERHLRQHVEMGGLLIRPINNSEVV